MESNPLEDLHKASGDSDDESLLEYDQKKIEVITDESDPDRCQALIAQGQRQCNHKGALLPNGKRASYCRLHSGNTSQQAVARERQRNYALTRWRAQVEAKADNSEIKSLREEIGILRVLLETRLNQCQSDLDLLCHSAAISDMVDKIQRVVVSCHKLEGAMGQLLDKAALIQFAGEIISVISNHITDANVIKAIGDDIISILDRPSVSDN